MIKGLSAPKDLSTLIIQEEESLNASRLGSRLVQYHGNRPMALEQNVAPISWQPSNGTGTKRCSIGADYGLVIIQTFIVVNIDYTALPGLENMAANLLARCLAMSLVDRIP